MDNDWVMGTWGDQLLSFGQHKGEIIQMLCKVSGVSKRGGAWYDSDKLLNMGIEETGGASVNFVWRNKKVKVWIAVEFL
jgi:hypothetical protein